MSISDLPGQRPPTAPTASAVPLRPFLAIPTATIFQSIVLATILLGGFLLRLIASRRLTPHVDEASSILAAHATATHGWPLLPSGTVYLQGATLSGLLAPLIWLGWGDLNDLATMRLVAVLAGTLTLFLCYRLGVAVTGEVWVGLAMALLVAIDPVSVQWSGHVRMYGLLQAVAVGLAWAFVTLVNRERSWPLAWLTGLLCWLAVFTHVGASLLLPAMALATLLVHGRAAWRRFDIGLALGLGGMAPLALLGLNRWLGTANVEADAGDTERRFSFVGDNLLAPLANLGDVLNVPVLDALSRPTTLVWLVPSLLVALATLIGGRYLMSQPGHIRNAAIVLLCFYWLPVLAVGLFTMSPKERYLLHVHVIGYLFAAVLVASQMGASDRWRQFLTQWRLAVVVLMLVGSCLSVRLDHRVVHPDYHAAMAYVTANHAPGEPIVVSLPAIGYLAVPLADRDDLVYLAGGEGQPRAQRYTRVTPEGDLIDYWVGAEAITTTADLRDYLERHPDAWIVVDEERLGADWAYRGEIERTLAEMTVVEHRTAGGGLVLRAR